MAHENEAELRTALAKAQEERDLAISHDRQPYPTAWAYEQACKALEAQRQRANEAESMRDKLATLVRSLADPNPCYFDPHGGCQEHGYLTPNPTERCPHAEAKEVLAAMGIELEA